MPKPVALAEPVRIERLSHEGRGVGRIDGKAVFVEGALAGELVRITLLRRRGRFDEARCDAVLEAAPERVSPPCEHFGVCGGCSLQHLAPAAQVAHKQAVLLELLEREGVLPDRVLAPLTGPTLGYRRKARLGVKLVPKKGGVLVGFRERGKPYIADLGACPVLHPAFGARLGVLRELIAGLSIPDRIPQLEVAVDDDGRGAMILRHLAPLDGDDRARLEAFGTAHDIDIHLQPAGPDSIAPLAQAGSLHYRLGEDGIALEFGVGDFTQVNFDINRAMVARVLELLDPQPGEQGLDLFCGLGNFTLPLARRGGQWLGLEGDPALIDRATANAARNDIATAQFSVADLAADPLPAAVRQPAERVLIDPPRTGAELIVGSLDFSRLKRLVYVSCNPATLARDSAVLLARGLRLQAAGIMDMFPHTAHVESMAVFEP